MRQVGCRPWRCYGLRLYFLYLKYRYVLSTDDANDVQVLPDDDKSTLDKEVVRRVKGFREADEVLRLTACIIKSQCQETVIDEWGKYPYYNSSDCPKE